MTSFRIELEKHEPRKSSSLIAIAGLLFWSMKTENSILQSDREVSALKNIYGTSVGAHASAVRPCRGFFAVLDRRAAFSERNAFWA